MDQRRRMPVRSLASREAKAQEEKLRKRRERLFTQALLAAVLLAGALILEKLPGETAEKWQTQLAAALEGDESGRAIQVFQGLSEKWTTEKPGTQEKPETTGGTPQAEAELDGAETEAPTQTLETEEESEKNVVPPVSSLEGN